ncbi:hypothetical protein E2562_032290 [Oryza meyeriana var. granulata]|uniref:SHSP domain-containing protein n=1 Tax=Oryza meyeriana var. granulata TaxID=110450 RepID=A0A6G1F0P2_9ORYZ|nr:hypothetical protein E2562_032290 [Oryza meyeriana var. granulata]
MSMVVASYALVSRSPVITKASSGTHSQSWRPPPFFFPASAAIKCRRPTLSVACSAGPPEKHRPVFTIPPTALLYPVAAPDGKERWEIKDGEDNVQVWLQVPGISEEDLEITTTDDLLEIKRKGEPRPGDVHGVGSFHLRLLLTKEHVSSQVTAVLKAGMLQVTVPKSKDLQRTVVKIGQPPKDPPKPPAKDPSNEPLKDPPSKLPK